MSKRITPQEAERRLRNMRDEIREIANSVYDWRRVRDHSRGLVIGHLQIAEDVLHTASWGCRGAQPKDAVPAGATIGETVGRRTSGEGVGS